MLISVLFKNSIKVFIKKLKTVFYTEMTTILHFEFCFILKKATNEGNVFVAIYIRTIRRFEQSRR